MYMFHHCEETMSNRRKTTMEVRTVVNYLRGGSNNRSIARSLQIDRRTVQRLRVWAQEQGLLAGDLPEMAELHSQVSALYGKDAPPKSSRRWKPTVR